MRIRLTVWGIVQRRASVLHGFWGRLFSPIQVILIYNFMDALGSAYSLAKGNRARLDRRGKGA